MIEGLKLSTGDLAKLRELYGKESELSRRQLEYKLASDLYSDVATRYEQTRIRVASRGTQLSIIDPALPPTGPIAPQPGASALMAALVGFLLAVSAVVLYEISKALGRRA